MKKNKAVFLDRDGVVNEDRGYTYKIEDFALIPNTVRGLKLLQKAGFKTIIITNQSGIARGIYPLVAMQSFNKHLQRELMKRGVKIDAIYFCPHFPEAKIKKYRKVCNCRKPRPGMVLQAQKDFNLNLKKSFIIGDQTSDIALGKKLKIPTFLVLTGQKGKDGKFKVKPDYQAKNLFLAAKKIIKLSGRKSKFKSQNSK